MLENQNHSPILFILSILGVGLAPNTPPMGSFCGLFIAHGAGFEPDSKAVCHCADRGAGKTKKKRQAGSHQGVGLILDLSAASHQRGVMCDAS